MLKNKFVTNNSACILSQATWITRRFCSSKIYPPLTPVYIHDSWHMNHSMSKQQSYATAPFQDLFADFSSQRLTRAQLIDILYRRRRLFQRGPRNVIYGFEKGVMDNQYKKALVAAEDFDKMQILV